MKCPLLSLFAVVGAVCLIPRSPAAGPPDDLWSVTVIDELLDRVAPDQKVVQVGDMEILAGPLRTWRARLAGGFSAASAFDGTAPAWPGGVLYYTFDSSVIPANQRAFLDAAAEWALFANLRFLPRTAQANYFTVLENPSLGGGQSAVGMIGGQQFLQIGPGAWNRATLCHEIGHTLGLVHEQQRPDRDAFVTILNDNVIPGAEGNFIKLPGSLLTSAYDFFSVMHYRRDAFSIEPGTLDTIQPQPAYAQFLDVFGQQYDPVLSPADRAGMAARYGAGPALSGVVTNTQDSGPGSLRAALYFAVDHPGTTITFNLPVSDPGFVGGVFTIRPTDRLPALVNATLLDGSSQPGNSNPNGPEIVLNGALTATPSVYADGLHFKGTNCVAQSLVINGFSGTGVMMDGANTTGNTLRGCFVGVDPSGTSAVPNRYSAVVLAGGASRNLIGGTNAAARNVISGSTDQGVAMNGPGTQGNRVQGNYIGLTAAGTSALPNAGAGVNIYDGAQGNLIGGTNLGARNVISGNTLQGVAISSPNAVGNSVQGNLLGLNPSGTTAIPNGWSGLAIFGGARSNLIGGDSVAARNVISGNTLQGATISDAGTSENVLSGNYLGLNAAGTGAIPNGWSGVQIFGGAQSNRIGGATAGARNTISGNALQGIVLTDPGTSGNVIAGNHIGVNLAGNDALANGWSGVELALGVSGNRIGGTAPGEGNLISGNGNYGVVIGGTGTRANVVAGNFIGASASGAQAVANQWSGVALYGGATANVIGGAEANAGNVISGNLNYGVNLAGQGVSGNLVQGNRIGLASTGAQRLGNGWDGVGLNAGASGNVIGLSVNGDGAGNVIAFNALTGIVLFDDSTANNTFRGNGVFSNGYLGINLVGPADSFSGVTLNDSDDSDTGPNRLQNFPTITNAITRGSVTTISGRLNSTANRTFLVDVYRNISVAPSGYGEGQNFVGTITATTGGDGNANFTLTTPGHFAGQYFTATATDQITGDTSEFSATVLATNGPAAPAFASPAVLKGTGFTATVTLTLGQSYRVQATTNLGGNPIPWVNLTNFTAGTTNFTFLDRAATNLAARFYRVVSP